MQEARRVTCSNSIYFIKKLKSLNLSNGSVQIHRMKKLLPFLLLPFRAFPHFFGLPRALPWGGIF